MDYSKLGLFDFFKVFFSSSNEWNNIPNEVKKSHSYMLMQYLSISFPWITNILNKEYSIIYIDLLHEMFKHHNKPPGWMYTKINKVQKEEQIDLSKYPKEVIDMFIAMNTMNKKDFQTLLEQKPEELKKYLENQTKSYNLKNKIT